MKRKTIISTLIIILIFIISFPTVSRAGVWSDIFNGADNFVSKGKDQINQTDLKETSSEIYYILLYLGIAVALIAGAILGIQFLMASAEEKAKVKEQMIPYIIGCFVTFGAFAIWQITVNILNKVV